MSTAVQWNEFADLIAAMMADSNSNAPPDTCSIRRDTETDDNAGGWGETPANAYTGVPCRFSDGAGMEQLLAGGQQGFLDGVVFLPARFSGAALSIRAKDRIVIAARGLEPARTFEVIGFGPGEGVLISTMVRIAQT